MVLTSFLCLFAGEFLTPPPDISVPLGAPMVARSEEHFYLLDYTEALIYQYTLTGKQIRIFGGSGQGPGTFERPFKLTWFDNQLIVHDRFRVHRLDGQGRFIKSKRKPHGMMMLHKVRGGWLGLNGFLHEPQLELLFLSEDFSQITPVSSWDVPATSGKTTLNLVQDTDSMVVSHEGDLAWIKPRYASALWKYDLKSGNLTPIALDLPPIPFDPSEGDQSSRFRNEHRRRAGLEPIKYAYPKTYPPIGSLGLTSHGNIALSRWFPNRYGPLSGREQLEKGLLLFLNPSGTRVEPKGDEFHSILVVARDKDWIYHLSFDPEQERTTLARIPLANAEQYLEQAMRNQGCPSC